MPRDWTEDNIAHMRGQMKRLGVSYDWRREIAAHRPEYYRWDQWFFLKMLERGLIYKRKSAVNWCPKEQTVLSNEQSSGGVCWRCGAVVEKNELEQWFVRITDYAEQLLDDMSEIEAGWPERVLTMQRNWIGRSVGAYVDFAVQGSGTKIRIFTTRLDTIFGATAVVVASDHPVLAELPEGSALRDDVSRFAERVRHTRASRVDPTADEEKEGLNTGLFAVNPFNGEQLPVWTANYVLMDYGTGAVMSVPAHDERDFEFAQKYSLPVRRVIERISHAQEEIEHDTGGGAGSVGRHAARLHRLWHRRQQRRLGRQTLRRRLARDGGVCGNQRLRRGAITYRLRDWGISRQRFWGAPIPIVYCDECGMVPVPEDQLPVKLPEHADFTGAGESPLAGVAEFVNTTCPEVRPAGAARDGHDGYVRRFVVVLLPLLRPAQRRGAPFDEHRPLDSGRSVYRRHRPRRHAPALHAFLDEDDARHRPRLVQRTGQEVDDAGHGDQSRRRHERVEGDVEVAGQRR